MLVGAGAGVTVGTSDGVGGTGTGVGDSGTGVAALQAERKITNDNKRCFIMLPAMISLISNLPQTNSSFI